MNATEIGTELVRLCQQGKTLEAVDTLYGEKVVSLEAADQGPFKARTEGLSAVREKNVNWSGMHEVHETKALGPFCGGDPARFAVLFEMDVTHKPTQERNRLVEVGLYTVESGKVVQEEFWYAMG
ncbi:MAG: SnoaL-like domain-containing protein [Myxococcota bacterium]